MHKKKKHKRLRQLIRQAEEELQNIRTLPYYTIFSRDAEQQADILQLQTKISYLKITYQQINKSTHKLI